jgi:hypothetical protein
MRLLAFVLALLLLAGEVDPTRGWLITLVVLTGISAFRIRPWHGFSLRPALDVRMASFVLAVLLLAGTIDPAKDWLIVLSAVTGVAMIMPGLVSLDDRESPSGRWRRRGRRHVDWTFPDGEPWR